MAPEGWRGPLVSPDPPRPMDGWRLRLTAVVRRTLLTVLVLAQTGVFAYGMVNSVLPYHGQQLLELAILSLSALLFAWVSLGFWTAITGFVLLCLGRDRYAITRSAPPGTALPAEARTAVVMPIRNEGVARVFAGCGPPTSPSPGRQPGAFRSPGLSTEPDTLTAERTPGATCARASRASAAFSIAGGGTTSSARAATSRTSAGAGGASTGTWSSWTRTAS
jgi:hypothetical protein